MKSIPLLALIGAFSLFIPESFAQAAASRSNLPPLPSGQLVRELAPQDSWTITFEGTQKEASGKTESTNPELPADPIVNSIEKPAQVTITRLEPYLSVRFFDNAGKNLVGYFSVGRFIFLQSARETKPVRTQFPRPEPGQELLIGEQILLSARDKKLPGFDWVGPATYVGVETIEDVPCFVFKDGNFQAWIDQKKLEPVLWKSGQETRRFKNNGAPATNDIPQAVMARMEGMRKDLERFKKSPKGG
jgi:hypothetical protein